MFFIESFYFQGSSRRSVDFHFWYHTSNEGRLGTGIESNHWGQAGTPALDSAVPQVST